MELEKLFSERFLEMAQELLKIFVYIIVPALGGITFFALSKFLKHITPLRALVSSVQVYKAAFWGLFIFGLYLALRPLQVLAGPHPWPLIISCIREFLLIGCFGPATFIAMMTLCYGPEKIRKRWIISLFAVSILMASVFCYVNAQAVGGSREIVKFGMLTAYDGLWSHNNKKYIEHLMRILFVIRLINPGFLLLVAATFVHYHGRHYPEFRKRLYDNMPKKLYILSDAVYIYVLTLIAGSFFYGFRIVPDQWGLYHLGALGAGILEMISLSMPVRNDVQVSEHEDEI